MKLGRNGSGGDRQHPEDSGFMSGRRLIDTESAAEGGSEDAWSLSKGF